ncbi:MAG: DUF354 domain-containing protein, partial [Melioribacteraceae bacterium]|nr:DUF354 domain-containing protein [Melioribacteraceae bacterium]
MKIWIDLTNSPHVNFFKPFIKKWKEKNFEIILTTRNLANTIELIEQNGWKYHEIGGHAGKNKVKKLLFFPKRIYLLRKFLKSYMPDIGISHSSFYSPLVCKLLGIPSIYLNDNEHAKGNLIAFKFSSLIILPEFLKEHAYQSGWSTKYNVDFYPGIKEGIYLSQLQIPHKKRDNPSSIKTIYIRLEPWTAQYYSGKSQFHDDLLIELAYKYELIILPRGTL